MYVSYKIYKKKHVGVFKVFMYIRDRGSLAGSQAIALRT